jgi:hypothetical protein
VHLEVVTMATINHGPAGVPRTPATPRSGVLAHPDDDRAVSIPQGGQGAMTDDERAVLDEMRAEIRAAMDRAAARLDRIHGPAR